MVRVNRHLIFVQITSQNFSGHARSQVNSAGILHADLKATMLTTRLQHKLLPSAVVSLICARPRLLCDRAGILRVAPRPGPDESELLDMMICVSVSLVELPKAIQWPIKTATTVETSSQPQAPIATIKSLGVSYGQVNDEVTAFGVTMPAR